MPKIIFDPYSNLWEIIDNRKLIAPPCSTQKEAENVLKGMFVQEAAKEYRIPA